ncbi:hypothetical protein [Lewinella sp. IMCC34183]|uniref:hypothetical protein n=1 Tax=Lewinella sp. IMCC34183 TaxID=2248762 RepID=UPI000E27E52C|nr:hypothetical protein [Lewinella sp. IMCC34183]
MIRKAKITTLAELKKRKKQVRMESELAKREFAHSIGTTRNNTTQFLLKKVAAPVGGGILGLMLLNSIFSSSKSKIPVIKETKVIHEYPDGKPYVPGKHRSRGRSRIKRITSLIGGLRVAMPIIQAVIGAITAHRANEAAQTAKHAAARK